MAEQFTKGGQQAWFHDPGHWSGFFHSYDHFQPEGASQPRPIHVFLPREYEFSQKHYPVIYFNDGDSIFFPGGAYHKTWDLGRTLTKLYLRYQLSKVIVVAVAPVNRDYEYTHAPVWGHEWGGLNDYAHYLATTVKGFIDANYRTLTNPDQNLIVGASHGGLAAFYTACLYSQQFGCVAALSPSFWVGLDSVIELSISNYSGPFLASMDLSALLFVAEATLKQKKLKIYLDWGLVHQGGFHNEFIEARATARGREMRALLINKFGYREYENLFVVEDPLGQHWEESWSSRIEQALPIFFGCQ